MINNLNDIDKEALRDMLSRTENADKADEVLEIAYEIIEEHDVDLYKVYKLIKRYDLAYGESEYVIGCLCGMYSISVLEWMDYVADGVRREMSTNE
ncbi:hypothetical protein [Schinkia azotoformans]|uniref:hypothetical protein n=1 Tax=Schinkia azotoformans TaxID=1454 RepID=UPI002DBE58A6|nr:hypothetical protein [Schinkia azotoformans]MEC1757391.1 hypothetical protein [Schinkia azotoformans]